MTLCIAAICREENKIVTVTDFLLSDGESSFESRFIKVQRIGNTGRWLQLYAGDPSHCIFILGRIIRKLAEYPKEGFEDLIRVYREALREERRQKIEDTILSRFGLNLDTFTANGLSYFGPAEFPRLLNKIATVELETEFLIAGFDDAGHPHLFAVNDEAEFCTYDIENFHAIGEGARLADASLIHNFETFAPIEDIIYRLCEAKVRSHESVPSVGKPTYLSVLEANGDWTRIRTEPVEELNSAIKRRLKSSVPTNSKDLISKIISDAKKDE